MTTTDTALATTVQLVLVTPLMATQWIERNDTNRALRAANVNRLATDIIEGRWKCDPSLPPVAIGSNGQLLNGQHRLHAVVKSGVSVHMYVAFNVDPELMPIIDQNISRQAGDVFKIKHHLTNSKNMAAAIVAYHRWLNFPHLVWQNSMIPSVPVLLDIYEQDIEGWREALAQGERVYRQTRILKAATTVVSYRVNSETDETERWFSFIEGVATGVNLQKDDPRIALRSWALNATSRWGGNQWAIVGLMQAWKAYIEGRTLRQIKARVDMLPMKDPA